MKAQIIADRLATSSDGRINATKSLKNAIDRFWTMSNYPYRVVEVYVGRNTSRYYIVRK